MGLSRIRLALILIWFGRKLRTTLHPSNNASIDLKLCQNAFQTMSDISFFDAQNKPLREKNFLSSPVRETISVDSLREKKFLSVLARENFSLTDPGARKNSSHRTPF